MQIPVERRSSFGRLPTVVCLFLTIAAAGLAASAARAARPHEFKEFFAEHCAAVPCAGAQLLQADGVAVDEATGDVYVVDKGEASEPASGRVVRFSANGGFISEFKGTSATGSGTLTSGSSTVELVLTEVGEFNVGQEISAPGLPANTTIIAINSEAKSLKLSQAATSSELTSLSAHQDFETPETIAVDNSCALRRASDAELTQETCEEEDPSDGDVYVVDRGRQVVDKYTSAGAYIGQIPQGKNLSGVAVDRQGHVWVLREEGTINEYGSNEPTEEKPHRNEFIKQVELTGLGNTNNIPISGGLAIDSDGSFYLVHGPGEATIGKVAKARPSGAALAVEFQSDPASAVALNQANDDPYVDDLTTVAIFDPDGSLLERLGEEGGIKHLTQGAGIGVNASADSFYVADAAAGTVVVFGPAAATTPKIEDESFSEVTASSALLAAKISPRSEPGEAPTEYRFQYGRCVSVGSCAESGYEASRPVPDGQIQADFDSHEVTLEVRGLEANTSYHFRVLAQNSHGEAVSGAEEVFTTQTGGGDLILPDNRGWELVSPPDKRGALIEPIPEDGVVQAAADGVGIAYLAASPTEAQPHGYSNRSQVLSRRGEASWSSHDIAIPHSGTTGLSVGVGPEYKFFDPGLQLSAVQPFGQFNPQLSEEASESTAYLHDLTGVCATHCYRPLVTGRPGFANVPEGTRFGEEDKCQPQSGHLAEKVACGPKLLGASTDLSHVVLRSESEAELKSGAGPEGLYEWSGGSLSQVNVLPDGQPAPGGLLGSRGSAAARGAISSDGSRIAWVLRGEPTKLYLRDMQRHETVQLDEADPCAECESGGGQFQAASADGSRVLFTDTHKLTESSGASPQPGKLELDLYECQITISAGKLHCQITDLTPPRGEEGAAVRGSVLGASEDATDVYFVASGIQSEAPNSRGQNAIAGKPNLYARHGGLTRFIATLADDDEHDWTEELARQPTRVSPNGQWLELMSQASLTGYDSRDVTTGKPAAEVYLYDAASNRLRCASCMPSGARPVGVEYEKLQVGAGGIVGESNLWRLDGLVAANVTGWANIGFGLSRYQPRYLSDSGRLFFNTADALVPQDSNGTQDVYQYELPGVGSCGESSETFSARSGGCVSLISSGRSAQESALLDASESGDDVFFLTSAKLSPLDIDTARDVYDAHRCTDELPCIAFPEVQVPPCTTEASCKAPPTPQPSIFGAPPSATFEGPGNTAAPQPKPKVKTAAEIRAEKLAKALKACRAKKNRKKRHACEKRAHKKYGPKTRHKRKSAERRKGGK